MPGRATAPRKGEELKNKVVELATTLGLNYLKATELPLGIVINFGNQKLEWRRFANTEK